MDLKKNLIKALNFCKESNFPIAEKIYKQILRKYPNNNEALINLGIININLNNFNIAEKYFNFSWTLNNNFDGLNNLILLKLQLEKYNEVIELSKKLSDSKEYTEKSKYYLARANVKINNFDASKSFYQELIEKNPGAIEYYIGYGYVCNLNKDYEEAKKAYEQAIKIDQNSFEALYNLGLLLNHAFRKWHQSIDILNQAANLRKNYPDLYLTQAVNFKKIRKIAEALEMCNRAYKIDEKNPFTLFQIGSFYAQMGENEKGIEWMKKSYSIKQDYYHAPFQIGLTYLSMGKFELAHEFYKYRIKETKVEFNDLEINSLECKKLIIHWEQGIGDIILYSRMLYVIDLSDIELIFVVPDKIRLFIKHNLSSKNNISIISDICYKNNKNNYIEYLGINMGSLTRYFNPLNKDYSFKYDLDYQKFNKFKKNKEIKVGLSWKSTAAKVFDEKSFDVLRFIDYFDLNDFDNINFQSLQYGNIDELLNNNNKKVKKIFIDNEIDFYDDIDGVLRLIQSCDFIVTCSNTNAHLAGALGKKTFLLLPKYFGKIWYWNQRNKNYSFWYPSIKIIEQKEDGAWESCYEEIKELIMN